MAGITSAPLRLMCSDAGAALCVSEMLLASELARPRGGAAKTLRLARWAPREAVRSAQLYAVRPEEAEAAAARLVGQFGVHHVDLNFGCPASGVAGARDRPPRILGPLQLARASVPGRGIPRPLAVPPTTGRPAPARQERTQPRHQARSPAKPAGPPARPRTTRGRSGR
jgi:hypothetical protein